MALQIPDKVPEPGFYYHYKHFGPDGAPNPDVYDYAYFIYEVGFHTEDDCAKRDRVMQVYRPLYEAAVYRAGRAFDLRPLEMFYQRASWHGREVDRFTPITDPATVARLRARYHKMYPLPAVLA